MSYDNAPAEEFLDEYTALIVTGENNDGFGVKICQDIDFDTLATLLCYIIKTSIGQLVDAKNINEMAEMDLLRLVEEKLIEDETKYLSDDEEV